MKLRHGFFIFTFLFAGVCILPRISFAKTAAEIDALSDAALEKFKTKIYGSSDILKRAKGVLVMPKVYRAGIGRSEFLHPLSLQRRRQLAAGLQPNDLSTV